MTFGALMKTWKNWVKNNKSFKEVE